MPAGGAGAREHRPDAARNSDVSVLDEDGVIEAEAVIETAAAPHGVYSAGPQAGVVCACQHTRAPCGDQAHERRRGGRYP